MSQKITSGESEQGVSPQQARALECLLAGQTISAAAEAASVTRETVHRWLSKDWAFQAAYNQSKRDLLSASSGRLLALSSQALETVSKAMESGNLKAALEVLKGIGLLPGQPPHTGDVDAGILKERAEIQQQAAQSSLELDRLLAQRF